MITTSMAIAAVICFLPTAIHIANDKNGDSKKINDIIVLTLVSGVIAWFNAVVFDISWIGSLALTFGYHILLFDYLINMILYARGIIELPAARHWFTYMGKTSTYDRIVSRVHPLLRLLIRVLVFGASVAIFIA